MPAAGRIAGGPLVAIVNQTMAEQVWPREDPIGRRFHPPDRPALLLFAMALLGCLVPVRRALRTDPVTILRDE